MERMSKRAVGYQIHTLDRLPEINKLTSHHRPINLQFYINGDQYSPGKKININPDRYTNFNQFLHDLTGRLAPDIKLPHGVRQIFTPVAGRRVFDFGDLSDGEMYVCAGFEGFKMMKYGQSHLQPWSTGQNWRNKVPLLEKAPEIFRSHLYRGYANNVFHPGRNFHASQSTQLRRWPGMFGLSQRRDHSFSKSNNVQQKPRVITIVRNGNKPRPSVKILLNHQAMLSYEQLLADISGAFLPHSKNHNIQRLFTVRGKEVLGISDFFREDDIFIAQFSGEPKMKKHEITGILEEMFPDSNIVKMLLHDWRRNQRTCKNNYQASLGRTLKIESNVLTADQKVPAIDCSVQEKRDSGFDSGDGSMNWPETDLAERPHILRPRKRLGRKMGRSLEKEETKCGDMYKDVGSHVAQRIYDQKHIDLTKQTEKIRDKGDMENQKDMTHDSEINKTDDVGKKISLISLNKISDNHKLIDESVTAKESKLKTETERMKEQLDTERLHNEREERENAEKAARKRMAEAEEEKHEEEISEKELMKATREMQTDKCVPHRKDVDVGILKAMDGSMIGPQNMADIFKINLSVEKSVNKHNLSVYESIHKVEVQGGTQADTGRNDPTDNQLSKKHPKQDPERTNERKRRKNKFVRKTKEERQVSSDDFVTSQFELGRILGDGNFANVYQSQKIGTGREYAVKVIDKSKLKGKEYMVEDEIRILKDCRHHNIIRLFEEFETPSFIYLVMELVKGGDLFETITKSIKFAETDSALMVKDLCDALFYLHSRRIVHRDIKPENLLVHRNKDGGMTLKLADFGLAMEVKGLIYAVCGTPTYVAPEILSETGYGLEVDMWAVGVITYILLCGFPPFRLADSNQSLLFESIKAGQFEFLSPFWDHVSTNATDLISHLLVVDKRKRYTAIDVLTHVWVVSKGQTEVVPDPSLFVDGLDLKLHQTLEEKAHLTLQTYQILRQKRRPEKN